MSVPKACKIDLNDYLEIKELDKQRTYSGYKRSKVLQSFERDLHKKKPIESVYWMTELILSGAYKTLIDKCIIFFMKNINISNPNLPTYILNEMRFLNRITNICKGDAFAIADIQTFRNHICEFVTILALSDKQRIENRVRCKDNVFNIDILKDKMEARGRELKGIWKGNDDETAYIPFNEFKYHISKTYNREKAVFWVSWILELYKRSNRNKKPITFAERCSNVGKRHGKYFVWLLWEIILRETDRRDDERLTEQINSIYELYKFNFAKRHVTSRISYILCCIVYLTQTVPAIRFTKNICNNYDVLTLMNIQINVLFKGLCNNYNESQRKIKKREFYKKSFPKIICETDNNIIRKRLPKTKPIIRKRLEQPVQKPIQQPMPDIMDMKYFSQVDKIANFQYRRSLNV